MTKVSGIITVDSQCISRSGHDQTVTVYQIRETTVQDVFGVPKGIIGEVYERYQVGIIPNVSRLNVLIIYPNYIYTFIGEVTKVIDYAITEDGQIKVFKVVLREVEGDGSSMPAGAVRIDPILSEIIVHEDAAALLFTGDINAIKQDDCAWVKDHYPVIEHMGKVYYYQKTMGATVKFPNTPFATDVQYVPCYAAALYHVNTIGSEKDLDEIRAIVQTIKTGR